MVTAFVTTGRTVIVPTAAVAHDGGTAPSAAQWRVDGPGGEAPHAMQLRTHRYNMSPLRSQVRCQSDHS
jgi:hypothetical protein